MDEQISKNIGISPCTLYEWKKKFPEFSEALKKGKAVVDFEVENALLKRALGYCYAEETTEEYGDIERFKKVIKHVPGDTMAQIFWLQNRMPDKWKDRRNESGKDTEGKVVIINDIPKPDSKPD